MVICECIWTKQMYEIEVKNLTEGFMNVKEKNRKTQTSI
jgi:hypothetical protein